MLDVWIFATHSVQSSRLEGKKHMKPSKLATWLLYHITKSKEKFSILGDYEEEFLEMARREGIKKAKLWYWRQVINSIIPFLINKIFWSVVMFHNYLKIVTRNIRKQKVYSLITILGLSLGLACALVTLIWVQNELSYDRFHENSDRIFRIISTRGAVTPGPLAPALTKDFPEITNIVRILAPWRNERHKVVKEKNAFNEEKIFYVDDSIFEIFTFPFISGDSKTALEEPFSLVITEKIAEKYFEKKNPIGETIQIDKKNYKITGVVQNIPYNSHFKFDFLIPMINIDPGKSIDRWHTSNFHTYILLPPQNSPKQLEKQLYGYLEKHYNYPSKKQLLLQPLTKIHLYSSEGIGSASQGNIKYVYIALTAIVVILMIASINHMNLTSVQYANRIKEVSVRKVMGASRRQIQKQFFGESIIVTFFALFIAIILIGSFLPLLNSISGVNLELSKNISLIYILSLLGIGLIVAFISASYPVIFASATKPAESLKSISKSGSQGTFYRSTLIIFQFTVSILLITITIIMNNQMKYIKNRNLGFNRDQVVVFPGVDRNHYPSFKNELLQNPKISAVASSSFLPIDVGERRGDAFWEGKLSGQELDFYLLRVDHDFIDLYEIEIIKGRNFSKEYSTDYSACILNESALNKIGWEDPIGKMIGFKGHPIKGTVVGVIKDFHLKSLHSSIQPLVLQQSMSRDFISIKISEENILNTIRFIEKKWQSFNSDIICEYYFIDEKFNTQYNSEQKWSIIFRYFATFIFTIACLGLLGIVSYIVKLRTKEIGIRKILGASVTNILKLIGSNFVKLILLANIIAMPFAWYTMNRWLQNFAYRIDFSWWTFLLSSVIALLIALLTVSWQVIRAAKANPVEALRYE